MAPEALGFELVDAVALVLFMLAWVIHFWVINVSSFRVGTISTQFAHYRGAWMSRMVAREATAADVLIQTSVQQGVLFFASTSILLIGALLAGLASADQAVSLLNDIPFASTDTRVEWEAKVLLVVMIFIFAFFKFAWAYRLFNYCIIMIGAAPERLSPEQSEDETPTERARREHYGTAMGQLHTLAAKHFTTGLNAYFFALCVVAWFLNAWTFMAATIWVSLVLYRRAFRSNFMRVLSGIEID